MSTLPSTRNLLPARATRFEVCLRIQPHEKVTVITDRACLEIAASLVHELEAVGAPYRAFVLEDAGAAAARRSAATDRCETWRRARSASSRCRCSQRTALAHADDRRRQPPQDAPRPHGEHQSPDHARRHARRLPASGSHQHAGLIDMVRRAQASARRPRRPAPILPPTLNPAYHWLKTSGIISPDKWGNLPGGEVFTTPGEVNGTFVIDGVVGDYLCEKFGSLRENAADHAGEGQPPDRGPLREQRTGRRLLGVTPTPTRTATASASSPSAPTSS